jgi:Lar family restriction alleviation protein
MNELIKVCPFCGSEAKMGTTIETGGKYYYIECTKCGAQMDCSYNQDQIVIDWNERKEPNPDGVYFDSRVHSTDKKKVFELDPCPVCGCTSGLRILDDLMSDPEECYSQIVCVECTLNIPSEQYLADAIEKWNRRAES